MVRQWAGSGSCPPSSAWGDVLSELVGLTRVARRKVVSFSAGCRPVGCARARYCLHIAMVRRALRSSSSSWWRDRWRALRSSGSSWLCEGAFSLSLVHAA
eukprot:5070854-Alexandrium_andersonii.AAC.1